MLVARVKAVEGGDSGAPRRCRTPERAAWAHLQEAWDTRLRASGRPLDWRQHRTLQTASGHADVKSKEPPRPRAVGSDSVSGERHATCAHGSEPDDGPVSDRLCDIGEYI